MSLCWCGKYTNPLKILFTETLIIVIVLYNYEPAEIMKRRKYPFFMIANVVFIPDQRSVVLGEPSSSRRDLLGGVGGAEGKAIYRIIDDVMIFIL